MVISREEETTEPIPVNTFDIDNRFRSYGFCLNISSGFDRNYEKEAYGTKLLGGRNFSKKFTKKFILLNSELDRCNQIVAI